MRSNTANALQNAARLSKWQRAIWIAKVAWAAPVGTKYYAHRNGISVGQTISPILHAIPACPSKLETGVAAIPLAGQTQMTLRNDPLSATGIEAILEEATGIEGTVVEVYVVFEPLDKSALSDADWWLVNKYQIDGPPGVQNLPTPALSFRLVDAVASQGSKLFGRTITRDLFGAINMPPESWGRMIPQIYGAVPDCKAIPVITGHVTELDGEIDFEDTTLFVKDTTGFPDRAVLLIDEEQIQYNNIDRDNHAFLECQRAQNNTEPTEHTDGAGVIEILPTYWFILSDHQNQAVTNKRVNDQAVTVTEAVLTLGGRNVTYLQINGLPTIDEISPGAQDDIFDGARSAWANVSPDSTCDSYILLDTGEDAGQYGIEANTAIGAVDAEEGRGVTFALLDAEDAKSLLAVDHTTDYTGRAGKLLGVEAVIKFKVLPNANLIEAGNEKDGRVPAKDFVYGDWLVSVVRDATEIGAANLPRPSVEAMRGKIDDLGLVMNLAEHGDRFVEVGQVSTGGALYTSGFASIRIYQTYNPLLFFIYSPWKAFANLASGDLISGSFFSFGRGISFDPGETYDWSAINGPPLVLAIANTAGKKIFGSIAIFIDIEKPESPDWEASGRINISATMGAETASRDPEPSDSGPDWGFYYMAPGSRETITLRFGLGPYTAEQLAAARIVIDPMSRSPAGPDSMIDALGMFNYKIHGIAIHAVASVDLKGRTVPIDGAETRLSKRLLMSSTDEQEFALDLTNYARIGGGFSDPWEIFAETLKVQIDGPNDAANTEVKILVRDIFFRVNNRPMRRRTLRPEEIVVTADVEGIVGDNLRAGSGTRLAELPEDVIYDLLTSALGWGLADSEIDSVSLLAALVDKQDWRFARRISQRETGAQLLASLVMDAGITVVRESGEFLFVPSALPATTDVDSKAEIDRAVTMAVIEKEHSPRDMLANLVTLRYAVDRFGEWGGVAKAEDATAQGGGLGIIPLELDSDWIRDTATAQALADEIVFKTASPFLLYRLRTAALWGAHLETGDAVALTDSVARLDGVPGRIVGSSFPAGKNRSFTVMTTARAVHWWEHDANTFIDVFHGSRFIFVINGTKIAVLDSNGIWRIAGLFDDETSLGTQTETREKVGNSIQIAVDTDGSPPRTVVLELTSTGNLRAAEFDDDPTFPEARVFADYGEEVDAGIGTASFRFSANKEFTVAKVSTVSLICKQVWVNQSL